MKKLSHTDRVNLLLSTQTTYKHLRGRHDQRDHAWNRGMGRGGTGSAAASSHPNKAKVSEAEHRADIVALQKKVDAGEMTYHDMQNKLRDNRGYPPLPPRTRKQMVQDGKGLAQAQANIRPLAGVDVAGQAAGSTLANRGPQSIISGLTERLTGFIDRLRNPSAPRVSPQMKKYTKDLQQTFAGKSYGDTMDILGTIDDKHPLYPKNFDEVEALLSYYQPMKFPSAEENPEYYNLPEYRQTSKAFSKIKSAISDLTRTNPEQNPRLINVNGNIFSTNWIKMLEDPSTIPEYQENSSESLLINPFDSDQIRTAINKSENTTNDVITIGGKRYFNGNQSISYYEWAWMADYFGEDVDFKLAPGVDVRTGPYHYGKERQKPSWFIDDKVPETLVNFGRIDDFQLYNPEIIPQKVQDLLSDNGKKLQTHILETHPSGSPVANTIAELTGLDVTNLEHMDILASALSVAEIPGTDVQIKLSEFNGELISEITSINPDTSEKVYAKRRMYKTKNGTIEIFNDGVEVKGIKGSGIGHALLAKQVLAARKIGNETGKTVDIKTDAMSATQQGDRKQQNGLHLWPRIGYNVTIPGDIKKAFEKLGFDMKNVKKTSELFKMRDINGILASEIWPSVVEQVMQQNGSVNAEGVLRATDITDNGVQLLLDYSRQRLMQKTIFSGEERPQTAAHAKIQELRKSLQGQISNNPKIATMLDTIESIISTPISENADYNNFVDSIIQSIIDNEDVTLLNFTSPPTLYFQKPPLVSYRGNHTSPLPSTKEVPIEIVPAYKIANEEELLKTWQSFSEEHNIYEWSVSDSLITPDLVSTIEKEKENGKEILSSIVDALKIREDNQNILQALQRNWNTINSLLSSMRADSEEQKIAKRILTEIKVQFDMLQLKYENQEVSEILPQVDKVLGYVTGVGVNVTAEVTRFHELTLGDSVNPNMRRASYPIEVIPENDTVSDSDMEQQKIIAQAISEFIEKYVDKRLHVPGMKLVVSSSPADAQYVEPSSEMPFPHAKVGSTMSSVTNTLHEFFHGIEQNNPEVKKLIGAFFASRVSGETLGMKQNGLEWIPDKFGDWYIGMPEGSMAPQKSSLEVLSMAASFFITDPVKFAREQPDYYRFIATLLSGKWMDE
jgi:hypothetical protein